MDAADDAARIRAIAAGDTEAFARLIDEHGPALLRFSRAIVGNLGEAEEIVQETFLRLWRIAPEWTPLARVSAWLHKVAYRASIDRLRRRRTMVDLDAVEDLEDDRTAAPDHGLLEQAIVADVRQAVDRLPHRQRMAIVLFHFQELTQSDAAAAMEISESAFESLLARARRNLRAWLAPEVPLESQGEEP